MNGCDVVVSKVIGIGNRVEFTRVKSERLDDSSDSIMRKKIYSSKVTDIIDETRIRVTMPIEGGHIVPVSVNTRLDACFYTPKGLYHGRVVVLERMNESNIYEMVVELQYELKKFQRRQYYRLNCTMDLQYRLMNDQEYDAFEQKGIVPYEDELFNLNQGVALDFSGGGIRFISREKHKKNDYIFIKLKISYGEDEKVYVLVGRVISSIESRNGMNNFEHRIEFVDISNKVREEIIKYIFMEERRQRKSDSGAIS